MLTKEMLDDLLYQNHMISVWAEGRHYAMSVTDPEGIPLGFTIRIPDTMPVGEATTLLLDLGASRIDTALEARRERA